ncbi:TetR/AcrR family transcriptional regulator [Streptomyces sp. NPDC005908]|uniref:TetR/AcrR family transcriptional regulator n=1 Tax=unclassified Streptomyces TaxID=2593676 RepID=UPI0011A67E58|nr:TetR/AcrR family transcriptional regulator [Streptomyces sp. T12]TWD29218.1 TetR family transcriptional regulator [Streptomyces sp. T12]
MARVREFDTEAAVHAAMDAFRCKGYEGTSIQDLVEATGVGRGSLYAAFGNKDGLYLAAMDRYRQLYAVPLIDMLRAGTPARELLREVLVATVDDIVQDGARKSCLIVGATTERVTQDPKVAAHVRATTSSIEDALRDVISSAQADGQLPDARNARDLARYLIVTMQGLKVMGAINPDRASLMTVAETALDTLG